MQRPVESMSGTQQAALLATGAIWTRWCLIIKPKNYMLASVNFFLGTVAGYQVYRIYNFQREKGLSVSETMKAMFSSTAPPAAIQGDEKSNVKAAVMEKVDN